MKITTMYGEVIFDDMCGRMIGAIWQVGEFENRAYRARIYKEFGNGIYKSKTNLFETREEALKLIANSNTEM